MSSLRLSLAYTNAALQSAAKVIYTGKSKPDEINPYAVTITPDDIRTCIFEDATSWGTSVRKIFYELLGEIDYAKFETDFFSLDPYKPDPHDEKWMNAKIDSTAERVLNRASELAVEETKPVASPVFYINDMHVLLAYAEICGDSDPFFVQHNITPSRIKEEIAQSSTRFYTVMNSTTNLMQYI